MSFRASNPGEAAESISPTSLATAVIDARTDVVSTGTSVLCRVLSGEHYDRCKVGRIGVGRVVVREPGLHHFREPVAEMSPLVGPSEFRWDRRPTGLQVVVADGHGQMVSRHEHVLGTFRGRTADYFPLKLRYTAIIVARGAEFRPPPDWDRPAHADRPDGPPVGP